MGEQRTLAPTPWRLDADGNVSGLIIAADGTRPVFIPYGHATEDRWPSPCRTNEERNRLAQRIIDAVNLWDSIPVVEALCSMGCGRMATRIEHGKPWCSDCMVGGG